MIAMPKHFNHFEITSCVQLITTPSHHATNVKIKFHIICPKVIVIWPMLHTVQ